MAKTDVWGDDATHSGVSVPVMWAVWAERHGESSLAEARLRQSRSERDQAAALQINHADKTYGMFFRVPDRP